MSWIGALWGRTQILGCLGDVSFRIGLIGRVSDDFLPTLTCRTASRPRERGRLSVGWARLAMSAVFCAYRDDRAFSVQAARAHVCSAEPAVA